MRGGVGRDDRAAAGGEAGRRLARHRSGTAARRMDQSFDRRAIAWRPHKAGRADASISSCVARARRDLAVNRRSVWAPSAASVAMVTANERVEMHRANGGWWRAELSPELSRADYAFSLDGGPPLPDPRSPSQPHGVHGLSRPVDHSAFEWRNTQWQPAPLSSAIIYECHIGTFTPSGTFDAADRASWLPARSWRDSHRVDAGGRVFGRARVGLRRRRSFRAASFIRRPGRDEALHRRGAWARPRRDSRRRLQSPRPGGKLPRQIRSVFYRSLSHAVGRRG